MKSISVNCIGRSTASTSANYWSVLVFPSTQYLTDRLMRRSLKNHGTRAQPVLTDANWHCTLTVSRAVAIVDELPLCPTVNDVFQHFSDDSCLMSSTFVPYDNWNTDSCWLDCYVWCSKENLNWVGDTCPNVFSDSVCHYYVALISKAPVCAPIITFTNAAADIHACSKGLSELCAASINHFCYDQQTRLRAGRRSCVLSCVRQQTNDSQCIAARLV